MHLFRKGDKTNLGGMPDANAADLGLGDLGDDFNHRHIHHFHAWKAAVDIAAAGIELAIRHKTAERRSHLTIFQIQFGLFVIHQRLAEAALVGDDILAVKIAIGEHGIVIALQAQKFVFGQKALSELSLCGFVLLRETVQAIMDLFLVFRKQGGGLIFLDIVFHAATEQVVLCPLQGDAKGSRIEPGQEFVLDHRFAVIGNQRIEIAGGLAGDGRLFQWPGQARGGDP